MRKIVVILFISIGLTCIAQENNKFQVGLSYSLTNSDEMIFKNPFSGYADYQVKKWENLGINAGLRVFYYNSKEQGNFSDKWGFNPNVSASYHFFDNKLNAYLAVGYYFDSFTFTPTSDPFFDSSKRELKTKGATITPGLRYFVYSNFFVDANVSLLFAKTKLIEPDDSNNTFFNIGIGVAF